MAFLNIFKRKEKEPKQRPGRKARVKVKEAKIAAEKLSVPQKPKKVSEFGFRLLKSPHVTEKATDLLEKNQYVFRVFPGANKTEIKKAVQDSYGVEVEAVRIVNIPAKKRRLGKIQGMQSGYKKAIIKIKEGQKIEILPR
ncbi:MAG: 50S ribosomal protein L23 [Candidatus Nealsonbacteria bacterium]|nr:50S ribosomal protein L23 [Candidatus Nealsonbacteria bacterium]